MNKIYYQYYNAGIFMFGYVHDMQHESYHDIHYVENGPKGPIDSI